MTCAAQAQNAMPRDTESSVTVYGGYRFGGSLTEDTTGASLDVKEDASYAVAVDIGLDQKSQVQLFYSTQETALTAENFAPTANNIELTIDYYHLAFTYFPEKVGSGAYVVGGLGATHMRPERDNLNSETFFSGSLGVGYMLALGEHVGLRFEARGYATLIDSDSEIFCGSNGGCLAAIEADALYQGEALVGLSVRF